MHNSVINITLFWHTLHRL